MSPQRLTFIESLMDENIQTAESLISKWDSETTAYACSTSLLFSGNRQQAKEYLKAIKHLRSAKQYFVAYNPSSHKLVRSQTLMQTAMKRLEKEFYRLLKTNKEYLDAESVSTHSYSSRPSRGSLSDMEDDSEDEFKFSDDKVSEVERSSIAALADLKLIADCMIASGYGKECVKIYKKIRKSIVDEALYHLGVEKLSFSAVKKMDWDLLEIKMKKWLHAVKTAVKTLFYGERILSDLVFSASDSIRESCFTEICKDGALTLFAFPENIAKCKKTPEKIFRTLDLYKAIADLWAETESIFSFESTSVVRSQAVNSLNKLGEAVRSMLVDFEAEIQKDNSKSGVPGGGIHPLTRYVMNYIAFLGDYSGSLSDIIADWPLTVCTPLLEAYFGSPDSEDNISSPIAVRLAWLILVLFCKLDGKAELYKDGSLSYLFLANNLQYVVVKARTSNLHFILGEEWVVKQEAKVTQYAAKYERLAWSKVFASLPDNPTAEIPLEKVRNSFRQFNSSLEDACNKQSSWIVPDEKLRDEIKTSLWRRIVPVYRAFYDKYEVSASREPGMGNECFARFAPDDLANYLSNLFVTKIEIAETQA
ncbi:exocyst complex component EXO70H1-like [Mangifera indica]|uniref:exocyst complex component EXO70H1-like n=1 Tax=Mangifera indica TaxID=29780 RepID=UPI001CFC42C7|nr:exocyst complex component EXO70H1-like [Mangifera indica]